MLKLAHPLCGKMWVNRCSYYRVVVLIDVGKLQIRLLQRRTDIIITTQKE